MAVTLGVGIAAINTGNNLLYLVLGLLLSLLLVSGTLSDLVLWRIRLRRQKPARLVVGQPALFGLEMRNKKGRLPSYAVEIEDLAEGEKTAERRCFFLKVGPGGQQAATYRRVPNARGPLVMCELVARTRFPFGLIEKGQRFPRTDELVVFPAPISVDVGHIVGALKGDGRPAKKAGVGPEVRALREYRDGDDARLVHWRRSAQLADRDRLVVREMSAEAQGCLAIVLDERDTGQAHWAEAFEHAIGQAAFLVEWAVAEGIEVEVRCRGSQSARIGEGRSMVEALRFLALLTALPKTSDTPLPELDGSVFPWVADLSKAPPTPVENDALSMRPSHSTTGAARAL